ncbi:MAG: flagellar hook capping FlgD N-terminal domain-containing protein [Bryobacterales bacterium]
MPDAIGLTTTAATTPSNTERASIAALSEKDTFLRLLIAQVQNQDPLNPQEPVEFVSQLAQFSQLETLLAMRTSLEGIAGSLSDPEPPAEDPGASEDDGAGAL